MIEGNLDAINIPETEGVTSLLSLPIIFIGVTSMKKLSEEERKEHNRLVKKKYREANKEKIKAYDKAYWKEHRKEGNENTRRWRANNPEKVKNARRNLRNLVLEHYGISCACCGEHHREFLCIDHINGNGNKHRKEIKCKGGNNFYIWLVKNGFPEGFRTLCSNCNSALGRYGYCPHKNI